MPDLDLVVEIPPDSMTVAIGADGTPMTVPVEPEPKVEAKEEEAPPATEEKPAPTLAELEQARREAAEERTKREAAEAAAAERAKEAEERAAQIADRDAKLEKANRTVTDRTIQGWAAHASTIKSEHDRLQDARGSLDREIGSIKSGIKAASEAGEHERVAELTAQMAEAMTSRAQIDNGIYAAKAEYEKAANQYQALKTEAEKAPVKVEEEKPKTEAKQEAKPEQFDLDKWIDTCPTKTQGWLKEHKADLADMDQLQDINAFAKRYARKNGGMASLNSDKFVAALNAEFYPSEDETVTEEVKTEQEPAKAKAKTTVAAPVSRGNDYFSSTNLAASKIRVPADVVAFCKQSGLKVEPYVEQVREDIRAGKLPKEWLDPGYDRGIK